MSVLFCSATVWRGYFAWEFAANGKSWKRCYKTYLKSKIIGCNHKLNSCRFLPWEEAKLHWHWKNCIYTLPSWVLLVVLACSTDVCMLKSAYIGCFEYALDYGLLIHCNFRFVYWSFNHPVNLCMDLFM